MGAELLRISCLHVEEEDVGICDDIGQERRTYRPSGIHTRLNVLTLTALQTLKQELGLHKWFST